MNNTIVMACDTEGGFYHEIRGNVYGFRAVVTKDFDPDDSHDFLQDCDMWACREEDAALLVDKLSIAHPGKDIKTFNLTAISYRAPGELKKKNVTKDGVFP